jgi:hypothetical protein
MPASGVTGGLAMFPHDALTWGIMLCNLALLAVLYVLIRGRRTN